MDMTKKPATIKDIAAHLGIDPSSVSRALNGHGGVSEETRKRIQKAADELGYVINLSARHMVQKQSMLVGLLVPDIRNEFHSTMASIMAEYSRKLSYQMVLSNTDDDPDVEEHQVRTLVQARVAGIVITPTPNPTAATKKFLQAIPTIQLLRQVKGIAGDAVCMDDSVGIRAAARHLLALEHTRIGYIGTSSNISVGGARLQGFMQAHEEAGVKVQKSLVVLVQPRSPFGYDAACKILSLTHRPTALIIGSTQLTSGVLKAIAESGLDVPRQLSVIGYGDPDWHSLLSPSLTSIRLPVESMAKSAVEKLYSRIGGKKNPSAQEQEQLHGTLVIRESIAAPAQKARLGKAEKPSFLQ